MAQTFKRLSHPGDVPHLAIMLKRQITDIQGVQDTLAPLDSPIFTGDPQAPTPPTPDNDTSIATTAFVKNQNYLTANQTITLSGDVTGSGATAIATTLRNSGVTAGSYNNLTVNAKGLATAGSNVAYLTGNQTVTLSGDASGSGTTTVPVTVNSVTGVATNSNAAAGKVGEVISTLITTGVSLPNATTVALATISLTAGDWDLQGEVWFQALGTAATIVAASIYNVAAAGPSTGGVRIDTAFTQLYAANPGAIATPVGPVRVSLAATTSYYLNVYHASSATATGLGKLWARRAR